MSEVIKQDLKTEALKLALEALEKLWNIIDDIDTYGDMVKADEKLYRSLVERRQRTRFEETGISTDGYTLNGGAITAIREALAERPAQTMFLQSGGAGYGPAPRQRLEICKTEQPAQPKECLCPACKVIPHASDCAVHNEPAYQKGSCDCGAQQWNAGVPSLYPELEPGVSIKVEYEQPEFFTHNVEQPYDWSDWVCPDPKSYLMKCCDCGLVHEAQFGVVRYKSETEREDCDMVDDPNLQAVFRMRRSEQWSPEDMAHRAGGLPMAEQPAQQQEPVALKPCWYESKEMKMCRKCGQIHSEAIIDTSPPASKPLTDEEIWDEVKAADLDWQTGWSLDEDASNRYITFARAIEAAHGINGDE